MAGLPPIVTATIDYEDWLRRQVDVVEADLHLKHRQMTSSLFAFLRATFYRWGPLWKETCPDLVDAPRVLAVGDLHVENLALGATKKGGWSGASMISMRSPACPTRWILCGL